MKLPPFSKHFSKKQKYPQIFAETNFVDTIFEIKSINPRKRRKPNNIYLSQNGENLIKILPEESENSMNFWGS